MKAIFILFSSICVSVWCVPAASFNEAVPTLNNDLATTATLHRIAREIDPFKIVQRFIWDIASFPERALEEVWRFIEPILARIRLVIRLAFNSIESVICNLVDRNNGTCTEGRRRRSSNETLPDLILNPLNGVQKILHQIENTTSAQIGTIVDVIVRNAWNFFTAEVLPWLQRGLQGLENSNILPSSLQNLIQSLEAIYFLLQVTGYIN